MSDEEPEAFADATEVGSYQASKSSIIRIRTMTGRDGRKRIDMRVFIESSRYTGPTKKGINLTIDQWKDLIPIIQKAVEG